MVPPYLTSLLSSACFYRRCSHSALTALIFAHTFSTKIFFVSSPSIQLATRSLGKISSFRNHGTSIPPPPLPLHRMRHCWSRRWWIAASTTSCSYWYSSAFVPRRFFRTPAGNSSGTSLVVQSAGAGQPKRSLPVCTIPPRIALAVNLPFNHLTYSSPSLTFISPSHLY